MRVEAAVDRHEDWLQRSECSSDGRMMVEGSERSDPMPSEGALPIVSDPNLVMSLMPLGK